MDGARRLLRALPALPLSLVMVVAGCGAPSSGPGGDAPTRSDDATTVATDGPVCLGRSTGEPAGANSAEALARPRLGPGLPARVAVCSTQTQRIRGQGEWAVRIEKVATSGVDALAAALRLPDEDAFGGACAAYADGVPELWAVDPTGHALLVRWPLDGCRHIRAEAKRALEAVQWRETGRRRLEQVTPQAAIDSGCPSAWKDMVVIEAAQRPAALTPGNLDRLDAGQDGSVCVFRVTDRSAVPTGTFERGARLAGRQWATLVADLRRAPALVRACSGLGDRFAVVLSGRSDPIYVELDGCRRIRTPDAGFRQATPAVLADLVAA
jgi:hypothetical protein